MNKDADRIFDFDDFEYDYPISFKLRNKEYLEMNDSAVFNWYCGDTTTLIFNLYESVDDGIDNFLDGKQVVIKFYNFRGEEIHSETFTPNEINQETYTINLEITSEISQKFTSGNYSCSVLVEDIEEENREIQTVADNLLIYVR